MLLDTRNIARLRNIVKRRLSTPRRLAAFYCLLILPRQFGTPHVQRLRSECIDDT
jgi:hypothetical protein